MAGGMKAKQVALHFEYFGAWHGGILCLQMHQTIPVTLAVGVTDVMPAQARDGGGGQPRAFPPEDNWELWEWTLLSRENRTHEWEEWTGAKPGGR